MDNFKKIVLLALIFIVENMEPHVKSKPNSLHRFFFTQDHASLQAGLIKELGDEYERLAKEGRKNEAAV